MNKYENIKMIRDYASGKGLPDELVNIPGKKEEFDWSILTFQEKIWFDSMISQLGTDILKWPVPKRKELLKILEGHENDIVERIEPDYSKMTFEQLEGILKIGKRLSVQVFHANIPGLTQEEIELLKSLPRAQPHYSLSEPMINFDHLPIDKIEYLISNYSQ